MTKSSRIIRGSLNLTVKDIEDYYSFMHLLRKEMKKKWKISDAEFWECVQMYIDLECPKKYRYDS